MMMMMMMKLSEMKELAALKECPDSMNEEQHFWL